MLLHGGEVSLLCSLISPNPKDKPSLDTWCCVAMSNVFGLSGLLLSHLQSIIMEKEMATHSSILAWRTPWTEEPGGLRSMESQGIGHN